MSKKLVSKYMNVINSMEDRRYLFSLILYIIAPTLDAIKPATIITLTTSGRNLDHLWHKYKEEFTSIYNIDYIEMKKTEKGRTILFYHEESLCSVLYNKYNLEFLKEIGYTNFSSLEILLTHLKSRFKNTCPHEMGIFLGIPLEEVKSFIENPKRECAYCGYWKVYNNPQKAKKQFDIYDKSKTSMIMEVLNNKLSI